MIMYMISYVILIYDIIHNIIYDIIEHIIYDIIGII